MPAKPNSDRDAWIAEHGSDHLKFLRDEGIAFEHTYRRERLALELPDFWWYDVAKLGAMRPANDPTPIDVQLLTSQRRKTGNPNLQLRFFDLKSDNGRPLHSGHLPTVILDWCDVPAVYVTPTWRDGIQTGEWARVTGKRLADPPQLFHAIIYEGQRIGTAWYNCDGLRPQWICLVDVRGADPRKIPALGKLCASFKEVEKPWTPDYTDNTIVITAKEAAVSLGITVTALMSFYRKRKIRGIDPVGGKRSPSFTVGEVESFRPVLRDEMDRIAYEDARRRVREAYVRGKQADEAVVLATPPGPVPPASEPEE